MDNREYRAIVDEFGDMVYRIALNQTRNCADADDIVQIVFLKLYSKPPSDINHEYLKHWLIRVTVNECKSLWRTLWRRRVKVCDMDDEEAEYACEPEFSRPDYEELYRALARLPEKCRVTVHLFYFEDCSTNEISRILGVREPTVRTRLARARKLLKQYLEEEWTDEHPRRIQGDDGRDPCPCETA